MSGQKQENVEACSMYSFVRKSKFNEASQIVTYLLIILRQFHNGKAKKAIIVIF